MDSDLVLVFVVSAGVILGLVLLVVLFVLYYQKRLMGQKMRLQNLEHERRSELLKAAVEAQERERARLSKDLHDDVGALLTATKMQVNQLEMQIADNAAATGFLNQTRDLLGESLTSVRRVSHDLVPPTLSRLGLVEALEGFAERFSGAELIVEFSSNLGRQRLTTEQELGLFRIVQELVNNTAKHAKASTANIELNRQGGTLDLNYHDNGVGFNPKTIKHGLGLKNLETRVDMLDGSIAIFPAKGKGFRAEITVPIALDKTARTS